jgi:hypothetical protein
MVAARKANLKHGANQFREEGAGRTLLSREEAADLLGVSKGTVQRCKVILKLATHKSQIVRILTLYPTAGQPFMS